MSETTQENRTGEMTVLHPPAVIPNRRSILDRVVMGAPVHDLSLKERIDQARALAGCHENIKSNIGKKVELHTCIVACCEWADDHGELKPGFKIWLVCWDGTILFGGSEGVATSLFTYETYIKPPPWDPPLPVTIKAKRTAAKRDFVYLDLDPEFIKKWEAKLAKEKKP